MASTGPGFSEAELREAVAAAETIADVLRRLGYCPTGNNRHTVKKYIETWGISTAHFDPDAVRRRAFKRRSVPLEEVLVEGSSYNRGSLKRRLYQSGLKAPLCELCGQGEVWRGRRMGLILDHVNGIRDDHRLDNLRIVCPNCAATLDTHCGKGLRKPRISRRCLGCGASYVPSYKRQKYCSRECGQRFGGAGVMPGKPRPRLRKVERPPYEQLLREIEESSWSAVGRKYGVSATAVRKWVRVYERERKAGEEASPGEPDVA